MCGDELPIGERELTAIARAVGLLGAQERMSPALIEYSLQLVHSCAQIGDGYWRDDASAGQHIRAVFHP